MLPTKPPLEIPIIQIIPIASSSLCTSTDEVGRKGRRRKRVLEQIEQCSLSQMTEKIYFTLLPSSFTINRCCLGTSQDLTQTTSKFNLCKKKKEVCVHVLVSPYLVSGLLFKSTLSNCVGFSWRFFAWLFVLERKGL